jgi:hypothetical protein
MVIKVARLCHERSSASVLRSEIVFDKSIMEELESVEWADFMVGTIDIRNVLCNMGTG